MTEVQQLREFEQSTTVPLEDGQSKIFWALQLALWLVWLAEGVSSVQSGSADWMDWVKIGVVLVATGMFGAAVILRRVHGHPRIEFHDWGLVVRTRHLATTTSVNWSEMDRVQMTTSQASIHRKNGTILKLPLNSYVIVRAVKAQLATLAQDKGVTVEGYC